jgi:hypothetical protein
MLLNIHDNLLLEDLQEHFSKSFPSLKIEFYRHPHHWKKGSVEQDQVDTKMKVGDVRKKHESGILQIKSTDTSGHVESLFKDRFGLNVQIFRKGKNCWIQTITTDNYTLSGQSAISNLENAPVSSTADQATDEYDFS